jgi:hypothetical protein
MTNPSALAKLMDTGMNNYIWKSVTCECDGRGFIAVADNSGEGSWAQISNGGGMTLTVSAHRGIVLQNSKVAAVKIFGENLKRKDVDDSHSFSRATDVAHEFGARRRGPSDHCTNNAPAALRIFDTSCKTTFATQSRAERTSRKRPPTSENDPTETLVRRQN